eukprot:SAG11_NODE_15060_length_590_cov_1.240326_1_plen_110_part_10
MARSSITHTFSQLPKYLKVVEDPLNGMMASRADGKTTSTQHHGYFTADILIKPADNDSYLMMKEVEVFVDEENRPMVVAAAGRMRPRNGGKSAMSRGQASQTTVEQGASQ